MKPEFIHNPRNLCYEDSLAAPEPEWFNPEACPDCLCEESECECGSIGRILVREIRAEANLWTEEQREEYLKLALERINGSKAKTT